MAEKVKNNKVDSQLDRIKAMMNYGLKTESKQSYRSLEHERMGADGKKYAIIREGAKYHIKVSDKKKPLKEDYDYIGGFQNHMNYMYDSYANALKNFDMKMSSLNEAYGKKGSVDSWNVNGREEILAEASDRMKNQISRMREIMKNTNVILEGKGEVTKNEIEKKNINLGSATTGSPHGVGGDFYTEQPHGSDMENIGELEDKNVKKEFKEKVGNKNTVKESVETITENETEECGLSEDDSIDLDDTSMDSLTEEDEFETEEDIDIETPEGDEDVDDFESEDLDLDDLGAEDEEDTELESFSDEDEEEFADEEPAEEGLDDVAELKAEIESLKSTISAIADKLGVSEFDEDEPLYPEEEVETEYELETDDEGDDEIDTEEDVTLGDDEGDDFEDDEEVTVYESRAYRQAMMNEDLKKCVGKACKKVKQHLRDNAWEAEHKPSFGSDDEEWEKYDKKKAAYNRRKTKDNVNETVLHDFGKHPRFKKEPFTYPNPTMSKTQGQWEAGDENSPSKGKKPYASTIGDPTPYGDGEAITKTANSIAESIVRKLLKNL